MQLTVKELATKYRVSVPSIYLWVTIGAIPDEDVDRSTGRILIESLGFEALLLQGRLMRRRGRKARRSMMAERRSDLAAALGVSEDQQTIRREGIEYVHRWPRHSHPYNRRVDPGDRCRVGIAPHLPAEAALAVAATLDLVDEIEVCRSC